jgi:hypothetical protein
MGRGATRQMGGRSCTGQKLRRSKEGRLLIAATTLNGTLHSPISFQLKEVLATPISDPSSALMALSAPTSPTAERAVLQQKLEGQRQQVAGSEEERRIKGGQEAKDHPEISCLRATAIGEQNDNGIGHLSD